MFKGFVVGFIVALGLVGGGVYYYFSSGMAPAAVTDPPLPFERQLAGMALRAHIARQDVGPSPVSANESTFLAGAEVYKDHCAMCHGLPNQPPPAISQGMYPRPPQLFRGKGVTDDPASETYWKVSNGIRLTGMPSFGTELDNTQMWDVAQLLANANKISGAVRSELVQPAPALMPAPQTPRSKAVPSPRAR